MKMVKKRATEPKAPNLLTSAQLARVIGGAGGGLSGSPVHPGGPGGVTSDAGGGLSGSPGHPIGPGG